MPPILTPPDVTFPKTPQVRERIEAAIPNGYALSTEFIAWAFLSGIKRFHEKAKEEEKKINDSNQNNSNIKLKRKYKIPKDPKFGSIMSIKKIPDLYGSSKPEGLTNTYTEILCNYLTGMCSEEVGGFSFFDENSWVSLKLDCYFAAVGDGDVDIKNAFHMRKFKFKKDDAASFKDGMRFFIAVGELTAELLDEYISKLKFAVSTAPIEPPAQHMEIDAVPFTDIQPIDAVRFIKFGWKQRPKSPVEGWRHSFPMFVRQDKEQESTILVPMNLPVLFIAASDDNEEEDHTPDSTDQSDATPQTKVYLVNSGKGKLVTLTDALGDALAPSSDVALAIARADNVNEVDYRWIGDEWFGLAAGLDPKARVDWSPVDHDPFPHAIRGGQPDNSVKLPEGALDILRNWPEDLFILTCAPGENGQGRPRIAYYKRFLKHGDDKKNHPNSRLPRIGPTPSSPSALKLALEKEELFVAGLINHRKKNKGEVGPLRAAKGFKPVYSARSRKDAGTVMSSELNVIADGLKKRAQVNDFTPFDIGPANAITRAALLRKSSETITASRYWNAYCTKWAVALSVPGGEPDADVGSDVPFPMGADSISLGVQTDQEWCHLVGHGDGGAETPANFIAGSKHCNTEQLAIEMATRWVRRASRRVQQKSKIKLKVTGYLVPGATVPVKIDGNLEYYIDLAFAKNFERQLVDSTLDNSTIKKTDISINEETDIGVSPAHSVITSVEQLVAALVFASNYPVGGDANKWTVDIQTLQTIKTKLVKLAQATKLDGMSDATADNDIAETDIDPYFLTIKSYLEKETENIMKYTHKGSLFQIAKNDGREEMVRKVYNYLVSIANIAIDRGFVTMPVGAFVRYAVMDDAGRKVIDHIIDAQKEHFDGNEVRIVFNSTIDALTRNDVKLRQIWLTEVKRWLDKKTWDEDDKEDAKARAQAVNAIEDQLLAAPKSKIPPQGQGAGLNMVVENTAPSGMAVTGDTHVGGRRSPPGSDLDLLYEKKRNKP